jgi:ketosteroid isomerase-like protein
MPKSRNRKNHKQKVNQRNQKIKGLQVKMQKEYTKMFEEQMEVFKSKFSAQTSDININADGEEIPFEVVETKTT